MWQGTNKFEQLIHQWDNGGAARFVHDALKHSFRHFDDRKTLVINTVLKTNAAVGPMAQSRSALEKCIVRYMLSGDFKSDKAHYNYDYMDSDWVPHWTSVPQHWKPGCQFSHATKIENATCD